MLKLKLQYFGYLMQRAHSLEKTLMLGIIEGKRRALTNSSKEHFNAEQTSQNNFCRLAEDIRQPEKQIIVFKNR